MLYLQNHNQIFQVCTCNKLSGYTLILAWRQSALMVGAHDLPGLYACSPQAAIPMLHL